MSSSRAIRVLLPLGIVLVALVVTVILIRLRPEPPKRPASFRRPVIQVQRVTAETAAVHVRGFGTVRAKRAIEIVPQVSGQVVEKSADFESGAFFGAGDLLLKIDDTDYALAAERTEAEVARARYNLALAEEEAEVARREWEQLRRQGRSDDLYPDEPNPLVFREPQLELARAELGAAEASLRQARVNLARCTIAAPFDGRVMRADVDAGQYVRAGSSLGAIYSTDVAEITVSIPDADLAWIRVPQSRDDQTEGQPVDIRADFSGAIHHWEGHAVRLGGAIDQQSRQVPVVIEVTDPYRRKGDRPPLVEGMFVEAIFTTPPPDGAVTIPRTALRPGNHVWVVTPEQRIEIRSVTVARAGVNAAVITAGLSPGDDICVSNLQYVTDGMEVRVPTRAAVADGATDDDTTAKDATAKDATADGNAAAAGGH